MEGKILIVEDEKGLKDVLATIFSSEGYQVVEASTLGEGLHIVDEADPDVIILDYRLPDGEGLELLRTIRERGSDVPVIFVTAYGTEEVALEALRLGAYNYVEKPFRTEEMKIFVERAIENRRLKKELEVMGSRTSELFNFHGIVGKSQKMREIITLVQKIGKSPSTVLITGESGTGKEMIARAIHLESARGSKPFIPVNCGAIPENLMESELFGHKKGAFTGAVQDRIGLFKAAEGGTIFLDEITEIPYHLQVKLLRVIETKTIRPLGSTKDESVNVRIICATNKDIEKEVKDGRFREDLYYRINVIRIHMPPLRERKDDIPPLADFFREKYAREFGKNVKRISGSAMDILLSYHFPGNVRELDNVIERAVAVAKYPAILPEDLPENVLSGRGQGAPSHFTMPDDIPSEGIDFQEFIENVERKLILLALEKAEGNKTKAARLLHLKPRAFRYLCEKYRITPSGV